MFAEKKLFLGLLLIVSLGFGARAHADDNVCVINNSRYDVTFEATGEAPHTVNARGGDQNQCFHFATIPLPMVGIGAGYVFTITAREPQGGQIVDVVSGIGFWNPTFGAGYFDKDASSSSDNDHWPANSNKCGAHVCVWHTGKTDVWRMYVIDG